MKKSTRELRQREADYRCCIPALAGFAGSQSIVPGERNLKEFQTIQQTISAENFKES